MARMLTLDEMVEQYKTNFRGALQALADLLGVPKGDVGMFDFDPVEEDDGTATLYAMRPRDGARWRYRKTEGWISLLKGDTRSG